MPKIKIKKPKELENADAEPQLKKIKLKTKGSADIGKGSSGLKVKLAKKDGSAEQDKACLLYTSRCV